ncbi:hypothetical protein [Rhodopirellula sp. MGV]|uniref:hypothetical protein n=1 Tax=Rhodopirellula sp. MGV TaxID=2023130 RepID=UPI000B97A96C|nr:hypothetical protein [Rhodopirellula sp. MGV]OYP37211.1 hypothetical protein CGZ80_05845 [Rhodopirellula sp. MGV]PNY34131.1 hypothetical protein C2E31_24855 [Rhodopirellula baltica]
MTSWAIHDASVAKGTLTNGEGRIPNIRENDTIVFFKRMDRDIHFVRRGTVDQVSRSANKDTGREEVSQVTFANGVDLEPRRILSDFTYSLERITRFAAPQFHFRNRIVKLSDDDFDTIISGRIFWSRTGFGTFVNSLPVERLLVFVQRVAEIDAGVLLRRANYAVLWPLLRDTILNEYADAHFYANEIVRLAESLRETGLDYELIRIAIGDTTMSGSLAMLQHDLAAFYESITIADTDALVRVSGGVQPSLFTRIDGRIERNSESERIFEMIFRATPWPTIHQIQI